MLEKKISWVAWNKVLASKKKGGLGVASFYALNRALLLKWVWRFVTQDDSLWFHVIQAIHGPRMQFDYQSNQPPSLWISILKEVSLLKKRGFDFLANCSKRVGDGSNTRFWLDIWKGGVSFRDAFPRLFALELNPQVSVRDKMGFSLDHSFRRQVRGGVESDQFNSLVDIMNSVILSPSQDRWFYSISPDGEFSVKVTRSLIDELFLPSHNVPTRWVKSVPGKVNVFTWKARRDVLPTRVNLIKRGITLESDRCPICESNVEDVSHILFHCSLAQSISKRICRWWEIEWSQWSSFSEWFDWFSNIRLNSKVKSLLEGVFMVAWWALWGFRNRLVFESSSPKRWMLFDDVVSTSFLWSHSRCNRSFNWDTWHKAPFLISL